MEISEKNNEPKKTLTVEELNIEILPTIYEIIRRLVTGYVAIFNDLLVKNKFLIN